MMWKVNVIHILMDEYVAWVDNFHQASWEVK